MAASTNIARPITPFKIKSNATGVAQGDRFAEKLAQTFLQGTPVQVDVAGATGYLIACPAIVSVATAVILGFSQEPGHNLAASGGAGGPLDLQGVSGGGGIGSVLTTGQGVPNQPSAAIMPIGAPLSYGTTGVWVSAQTQSFIFTVGNSNTAANATLAQTMVGAIFGLTKDAGNNFWYLDNFITTTAAGACLIVVSLIDPVGTLNGRVEAMVAPAAIQVA